MENYPYTILTGLSKTYLDKEFNRLILPRILEFIGVTIFFLIVLYIYDSRIIHLLDVENKLRKSLLQTNVNKAKLVRAVGHDLKNYVFGISELVKLILENKTSAQIEKNKDLKLIESISNQSDELAYFVEDLLDTNQNNNDEFNLGKMEECSIKDLINRMLILNKHLYRPHC
jgi:K+-sensing histidine kinase KdpD